MSRKRGKRHSRLAVVPLGAKRNKYELDARAALLALANDCANQQHLVDLYVLAELCDELTDASHVKAHCASVRRLVDEIHGDGCQCTELRYAAIEASANMLLDWFHLQPNASIARIALRMVAKIERDNHAT
jgi:hypothetical protein